jgi:Domain of unknown function (DUF222)/HNH endonuclease
MVAGVRGFESRLDGLVRGRRELDQYEAQWLFMVGEYARSGAWQADGFLSAAAAIQQRCNMNAGAARAAVNLAKTLERLPETQRAFDAGEISRAHAQAMADGFTEERAEQLAHIEADLVGIARRVDPKSLRAAVQRYTDAIDGDNGAGNDERAYEKNRFRAAPVGGRVATDGSLDLESGQLVISAVEAMAADLRQDGDTRRTSQRHAEALVEICRRSLALDHKHVSPSTRRRGQPHLSFVVDGRAYEAEHPDLIADIRIEAEHVGQLSRTTLERLSCDCEINRIVTDGDSLIIDVGRTTRNIPGPLWRALVVRDRHCQEPGCDRPPGWCEAHHIWHWEHGGPTNLANLELLCWQHHRQRHLQDARKRE